MNSDCDQVITINKDWLVECIAKIYKIPATPYQEEQIYKIFEKQWDLDTTTQQKREYYNSCLIRTPQMIYEVRKPQEEYASARKELEEKKAELKNHFVDHQETLKKHNERFEELSNKANKIKADVLARAKQSKHDKYFKDISDRATAWVETNGASEKTPERTPEAWLTSIQTHVNGSSNPKGREGCPHKNMTYNDETMGGCGSGWLKRCDDCGFVVYDD